MSVDESHPENVSLEGFDTVTLINAVKNHPTIWDTYSDAYHDKLKKREAWTEVCHALYQNFDEKSTPYKKELGKALIAKWRNIRDCYLKSLKKPKLSPSGQKPKQYIYAKQLTFLNQTKRAIAAIEFNTSVHNPMNEAAATNNVTANQGKPVAEPDVRTQNSKHKEDSIQASLINFLNTPVPSVADPTSEPNLNRLFFESVLPSLDDFSVDEIIDFRIQVLLLIKRVKGARRYLPQTEWSFSQTSAADYQQTFEDLPNPRPNRSHRESSRPSPRAKLHPPVLVSRKRKLDASASLPVNHNLHPKTIAPTTTADTKYSSMTPKVESKQIGSDSSTSGDSISFESEHEDDNEEN